MPAAAPWPARRLFCDTVEGAHASANLDSLIETCNSDLRFSPYGNAFLADAIILQRYIELEGEFKRVISVIKVRGSKHSKAIRLFDIEEDAVIIGSSLSKYEGILSGKPTSMLRGDLATD